MRHAIRLEILLFAALFGLLTNVGVVGDILSGRAPLGYDFRALWRAGPAAYGTMGEMPFVYPPTALLLITPLTQFSFTASLVLWSALGSAALFVAAARLAGPVRTGMAMLAPAWFVAALAGQTSLFVGALTIMGVVTIKRPWLAGTCFAAAAMIKPQALIALPVALAAAGQWRVLLWGAAAAAGLIGLSLAIWGVRPWLDWAHSLPRFSEELAERGILSLGVSFNALLVRFGLPSLLGWIGVALGLAAVWAAWRRDNPAERYAALVCGAALALPYMLHYDLAGLGAPALAMALDRQRPLPVSAGAALAVSYILAPFGLILLAVGLLRSRRQASPDQASAR